MCLGNYLTTSDYCANPCIIVMCRPGTGHGHLPVLLGIFMVVSLAATYCISVYRNDVDPFFPYISDAGDHVPESCLFAQLLNFASFLSLIIIYLRYRLVREFNRDSDWVLKRTNQLALFLGIVSALGISLVANFQEGNVIIVHIIGALMCFVCGTTYTLMHTYISYRMYPLYNGISICRLRLLVSMLSLIAFLLSLAFEEFARFQWRSVHRGEEHDIFHWKKSQPGYVAHCISAANEWILTISFILYFFTYIKDFDKLHVNIEVLPLVSHLDETIVRQPSEITRLII